MIDLVKDVIYTYILDNVIPLKYLGYSKDLNNGFGDHTKFYYFETVRTEQNKNYHFDNIISLSETSVKDYLIKA